MEKVFCQLIKGPCDKEYNGECGRQPFDPLGKGLDYGRCDHVFSFFIRSKSMKFLRCVESAINIVDTVSDQCIRLVTIHRGEINYGEAVSLKLPTTNYLDTELFFLISPRPQS